MDNHTDCRPIFGEHERLKLVTENQAEEIERLRGILAQIESYPSAKEGKSVSEWTEADAFHAVRKLARQGLIQYKVTQSRPSE